MTTLTHAEPRAFDIVGLETIEQAVAALEAAVARHPRGASNRVGGDRGMAQCEYITSDDRPSCIVGHVLIRAGVPVEWFRGECSVITEADDGSDPQALDRNKRGIHVIGDELGLPLPVAAVLAEAQMAQDTGAPWGYALVCARSMARQLKRKRNEKARRARRWAFLR